MNNPVHSVSHCLKRSWLTTVFTKLSGILCTALAFPRTVILISVLLAYFCRQVRTENVFMRNLADQCRSCIYLGMYCAWVIYLRRHVVHKKTRRCLTAIGCLMVFWFFVRTVKFHIFHDPLGEHICWYLYYIPMILIPVLGLAAAMFLGEKEEEKTIRKIIILLTVAAILIVSVFTNDLHQLVFRFPKNIAAAKPRTGIRIMGI